jgi:hypothetical protein
MREESRMLSRTTLIVFALGFALIAGATDAAANEAKYVGVKKCKSCHKKKLIGNQFGEWQKMKHAEAFETLKGEKALEIAKEKGLSVPPHEAEECLKCHVTAYGEDAAKFAKKPLSPENGVQCESCHGPGSGYKKKKTMSDHDKSVAAGMWEAGKDEKICTKCHNDESPTWDPAKYELAAGGTAGFDYEQAQEKIAHPIPEDVKGKYIEVEKKLKAEKGGAADEEGEEE